MIDDGAGPSPRPKGAANQALTTVFGIAMLAALLALIGASYIAELKPLVPIDVAVIWVAAVAWGIVGWLYRKRLPDEPDLDKAQRRRRNSALQSAVFTVAMGLVVTVITVLRPQALVTASGLVVLLAGLFCIASGTGLYIWAWRRFR